MAGYYSDGYWVPGRWAFVGVRDRDDYPYAQYYGERGGYRDRGWDRDRHDREGRGWRGGDHFRR